MTGWLHFIKDSYKNIEERIKPFVDKKTKIGRIIDISVNNLPEDVYNEIKEFVHLDGVRIDR